MIVQDEGHIAVQCGECKKVSAVVLPWAKDAKGRVLALNAREWPKACPHCGMIATKPCAPGLLESPELAHEADVAVRATMLRH